MSLAEDLAQLGEKSSGGVQCRLQAAFTDGHLDDDASKSAVVAAIGNHRFSNTSIAKVLQKNGIEVSESTVRKHRRNECARCRDAGLVF